MFASISKFFLTPQADELDDIESLLYLVCYCLDGFFLPWLQDYQNQPNVENFIKVRIKKQKQHHQYFYGKMPLPLVNAVAYVHMLRHKRNPSLYP